MEQFGIIISASRNFGTVHFSDALLTVVKKCLMDLPPLNRYLVAESRLISGNWTFFRTTDPAQPHIHLFVKFSRSCCRYVLDSLGIFLGDRIRA
jgi:hypothetical protein